MPSTTENLPGPLLPDGTPAPRKNAPSPENQNAPNSDDKQTGAINAWPGDTKQSETFDKPSGEQKAKNDQKPSDDKGGKKGKFWWVVIGVAVACVILLAVGIIPRLRAKPKLSEQTKEQSQTGTPDVPIVYPKRGATQTSLQLPGNMEAVQESDISARTSGYVRRWLVDLGDNVREGQVLAEIDAPEVDAQEDQARAQLAQAQAAVIQQRAEEARAFASLAQSRQNADRQRSQRTQAVADLNLARVTWERWDALVKEGAVSQQAADEKQAAYNNNVANVAALDASVRASASDIAAYQASLRSAQANVGAAQAATRASQANLDRFRILRGFQKVRAPFAGVITARTIDEGALIGGGADGGGGGGSSVGGGTSGGGAGGSTSGSGSGASAGGSQRGAYGSAGDSATGGSSSTAGDASGGAGSSGGASLGQGTVGGSSSGGAARSNAQGRGGVSGAPVAGGSTSVSAQPRSPFGAGGGSASGVGGAVISPGQSLFRIARLDVLRIQVNVPQTYASVLRVGVATRLVVREFPNATFRGRVTRTARALDPATRTLLAEIQISNKSKTLMPGMFAQVVFESPRAAPPLVVPSSTLINNAEGVQVAVVGQSNKVEMRPVEVGRDYGTELEITRGLTERDRVVINPSDQAQVGATVKPVIPKKEGEQGGGSKAGGWQSSGGSDSKGGHRKSHENANGPQNGKGQNDSKGGASGQNQSGPPANTGERYGEPAAGKMRGGQ